MVQMLRTLSFLMLQYLNGLQDLCRRTSEGTFPPGSEWTKNPLNSRHSSEEHGHVIDYVEVPSYLDHGRYVLSFRWDCQQSPQIWNVCANIDII